MKLSGLTSLAWLVLTAVYGLRTFLTFAPGGGLFWNGYFRGETGVLDRAEAILWVPVIVLHLLAFLASRRRQGLSLAALWHLAMCALGVLLLGEEISWGQHLFGFESSERMLQMNAQQESNFHNLNLALMYGVPPESPFYPWLTNFNHILNPAYYLFTCILFVAIPVVKRGLDWRIVAWIPAPNGRIVLFFAANVVAYLVIDKLAFDVGEIFELAITTTFALAALDVSRQARPVDSKPDLRVTARLLELEIVHSLSGDGSQASPASAELATSFAAGLGAGAPRRRRGGRGTLLRPYRKQAGLKRAQAGGPMMVCPATGAL